MLIIEIALGIVLAFLIIANLDVIFSLGLFAIVAVIGLGAVVFLLTSFSSIVGGLWQLITEIPYMLLAIAVLGGGLIALALIGAISTELCTKILGFDALTTTKFSQLFEARKHGWKVFYQVTLRYFAERMGFGLLHFLVLVVTLAFLTDYLNDYTLATGIVVSFYAVVFVMRKLYLKFKSTQQRLS
jgi:hypothetical protein